jgi:putative restriction endonuclease
MQRPHNHGMSPEELKQQIRQITVWKRGEQRAPHKPLLLLYALGRCLNDDSRMIPYSEVDRELRPLLVEFGPERKSSHTEYPFQRLSNDGIWELRNADRLEQRASNSDVKKSELLKHNVLGGFTEDAFQLLHSNPALVSEIALEILNQHFPQTFYADLLNAVGLEIQFEQTLRRRRDPAFRERVLMAYQYRCAVCGYDLRLGSIQVALEAAHIKWHQAGGPDVESNGLALCSMHHKLFDRGAFTINEALHFCVSQKANGSTGLSEWLMSFHGLPLKSPQSSDYQPLSEHLAWHRKEVFHGPGREATTQS